MPADLHFALLPNKFKKVIWVKRGNLLLLENGTGEEIGADSAASDLAEYPSKTGGPSPEQRKVKNPKTSNKR